MGRVRFSVARVAVLLALLQSACRPGSAELAVAEPGGRNGGEVLPDPTMPRPAGCEQVTVAPSPLRRLNRFEYNNTVRELLGDKSNPADKFVPDGIAHGFDTFSESLSVTRVLAEQYLQAAETLSSSVDLTKLLPCTPTGANAKQCAADFVQTFGAKAFRRPLQADEAATLQAVFDEGSKTGFEAGAREVIFFALQSPQFLYRLELTQSQPGQVAPLDGFELASRLSYAFWGTMPDAELTAAAAAGKLRTADEVGAQAERLLADPRAKPVIARFFSQWLELERLDGTDKDPALFPDFPTLKPLMKQETQLFVDSVFWGPKPTFGELFGSAYTFADSTLASFYGISGVTGTTFTRVSLPASRVGLLSHASILSVQTEMGAYLDDAALPVNAPIYRGKFVRSRVLCQELPDPPPGAATLPLTGKTSRELSSSRRGMTACSGCHGLLDPVGFAFQAYDEQGRYRAALAGGPIDSSGELLSAEDATGAFSGLPVLASRLAGSHIAKSCLQTQWFRFAAGREAGTQDACTLGALDAAFEKSGDDLRGMVVRFARSDAFRFRSTQ